LGRGLNKTTHIKNPSLALNDLIDWTFEAQQPDVRMEKIMFYEINGRCVAGFFNRCRVFQPTI
jgi:hypothetical protein